MSRSNLCSAVIILMLTCAVTSSVHAQLTVTSEEFQAPQTLVDVIVDRNADQDDPEAFLVTVTPEAYMKIAKESGETLEIDKTTFFADAKGDFAVETVSPEGKMTMVYKEREQTMNQIIWAEKKVIKTSVAEMKKMSRGATDARSRMQKNMPDLNAMFEGMTDEEKAEYKGLPDAESIKLFIEEFWRIRDPDRGTEENKNHQLFKGRIECANRSLEKAKMEFVHPDKRRFIEEPLWNSNKI